MAFTRFPDPTNNISDLANQPVEAPATLKQKFDQVGEDLKDYTNNTLLVELEKITDGDSGADNIGFTPISGGFANTVQGAVEEVNSKVVSLLPFPDGSITDAKLATDNKVGSLATLSALLVGFTSSVSVAINKIVSWIGDLSALSTTAKTSLVAAINELFTNKANKTQEAFITPTLLNSWVSLGAGRTVKYYKNEVGEVILSGGAASGVVGTVAFVLPANYRPLATRGFPVRATSGGTDIFGSVSIDSSGNVTIAVGSTNGTNFDGIIFRAEA